jgi:hypothetical protein
VWVRGERRPIQRAGQYADADHSRVVGGLEVDGRIAGRENLADIRHPGQFHRVVDEVRRGAPGGDLARRDDCVEQVLAALPNRPAERNEQGERDRVIESGRQ